MSKDWVDLRPLEAVGPRPSASVVSVYCDVKKSVTDRKKEC